MSLKATLEGVLEQYPNLRKDPTRIFNLDETDVSIEFGERSKKLHQYIFKVVLKVVNIMEDSKGQLERNRKALDHGRNRFRC